MRPVISLVVLALIGCADPTDITFSPDAGMEPEADASPDAGVQEDARVDVLPDTGTDSGVPVVVVDAGTDAGRDAGTDAGRDSGAAPDAGTDAGTDAGQDTGRDAGTDAWVAMPDAWVPPPVDAGRDGGSGDTTAAVQLALGDEHSCVLRTSGRARCWGNPLNAMGIDGALYGSQVAGLADGVAMAADGARTCAVRSDGSVVCWGKWGSSWNRRATAVPGIGVMDVTTAQYGVTPEGAVVGWDIGTDSTVAAPAISNATAVDQYGTSACAARADGSVTCWGNAFVATPPPSLAPFIAGITQVAVGQGRACVLASGGAVMCWSTSSPAPTGPGGPPGETSPYVEISGGRAHFCARRANRSVWCWGDNSFGQLGRDTGGFTSGPSGEVRMPDGSRMDALAVGSGRDHSCAALRDGRVMCWGSNSAGQLGTWVPDLWTSTPVESEIR